MFKSNSGIDSNFGRINARHNVDPPAADDLFINHSREVTVRDYSDLVHGVMAMRDCSKPDAERYINENGQERVERELQARGEQSTRWGGA